MRVPPQIALALRLSIFEGAVFGIYWNIVAGVIINGLALALGAQPLHFAILNGVPLLSQVFALPAAILIQSHDVRKPFTLICEGIARTVWLLVPLLVFFAPGSTARIWFVLAIAAFSHAIHAGGAIGWTSWISDLIPEQIRGFYFGARNAIIGLVATIGLTVASSYADRAKETYGQGPGYLRALLLLVAISVIFAAASWLGLLFQPVRKMRNLEDTGWKAIWQTLTTPNGRKIALAWVSFAYATGITTGIFMPYFLERARMSLMAVTIYVWVALTISTFFSPVWGRLSDRIGYRNVMVIGWLGVFWQPLLFVFTTDSTPRIFDLMPWTVLADAIAGGAFWPAWYLPQTNLLIAQAPSRTRAGLFAAVAALTGLTGFIGAATGGLIANAIGEGHTIQLGIMALDDLKLPMLLGSGLRLATGCLIFLIREPERRAAPVTGSEAFITVWSVLIGKPYRPAR